MVNTADIITSNLKGDVISCGMCILTTVARDIITGTHHSISRIFPWSKGRSRSWSKVARDRGRSRSRGRVCRSRVKFNLPSQVQVIGTLKESPNTTMNALIPVFMV